MGLHCLDAENKIKNSDTWRNSIENILQNLDIVLLVHKLISGYCLNMLLRLGL